MTLRFKRIHPDAVLPAYAHASDAGMDVRSVAHNRSSYNNNTYN